MILELLGYSALLACVAGSTLVFLKDEISQYAFLLWCYGNPIFIYLLIIGFEFAKELFFISYCVMAYTAIYGLVLKRKNLKNCKGI